MVACENPEPTGIDGQRGVNAELSREVGHGLPGQLWKLARKPFVGAPYRPLEGLDGQIIFTQKIGITRGCNQTGGIDCMQKFYGIVLCILPEVRVKTFEQEPGTIIPTPSQIKSEFFQTLNAVRNLRKTSCLHLVFEAEPSIVARS